MVFCSANSAITVDSFKQPDVKYEVDLLWHGETLGDLGRGYNSHLSEIQKQVDAEWEARRQTNVANYNAYCRDGEEPWDGR